MKRFGWILMMAGVLSSATAFAAAGDEPNPLDPGTIVDDINFIDDFRDDPEVKRATQKLVQTMRARCTPVGITHPTLRDRGEKVPLLRRVLLNATTQKRNGQVTLQRRSYLVSRYVSCVINQGPGAIMGVLYSVSARVGVDIRRGEEEVLSVKLLDLVVDEAETRPPVR